MEYLTTLLVIMLNQLNDRLRQPHPSLLGLSKQTPVGLGCIYLRIVLNIKQSNESSMSISKKHYINLAQHSVTSKARIRQCLLCFGLFNTEVHFLYCLHCIVCLRYNIDLLFFDYMMRTIHLRHTFYNTYSALSVFTCYNACFL